MATPWTGCMAFSSGDAAANPQEPDRCLANDIEIPRRDRIMQTHKPGLVPGGVNRTKVFHVKRFGTIGAKNFKRRKTIAPSWLEDRTIVFVRSEEGGGDA